MTDCFQFQFKIGSYISCKLLNILLEICRKIPHWKRGAPIESAPQIGAPFFYVFISTSKKQIWKLVENSEHENFSSNLPQVIKIVFRIR